MTNRGGVTTITRRLQFEGGRGTATARVVSCLCEGVGEVADKAGDARASVAGTLGALWSALTEQGETVPRDAARRRAKKFKVFGEACKAACAGFMVLFKAFAVFCALSFVCAIIQGYNKTLELELHIKRAGEKFKTTEEPVRGIAETFVDIASLDHGVTGLWENQHIFAKQLATAQDHHEELLQYQNAQRFAMESDYAEQQLRFNGAHLELVKAKEALEKQVADAQAALRATRAAMQTKFAEMHKNVSDSANRITRAKLRLRHNEELIGEVKRMLDNAGNHNIPEEEE